MTTDNSTAGVMKRLLESQAAHIDWTKARKILNVSSHEEALALLADALLHAREELRRTKSELALIVKADEGQVVLSLDINGLVVAVSHHGADLLGWPVDQILGRPVDMLLADRQCAAVTSGDEMAEADKGARVSSERAHRRADGSTFNGRHALFALVGAGGHVTGFVRKIQDVTQREAHEMHIEELDATIALLIG